MEEKEIGFEMWRRLVLLIDETRGKARLLVSAEQGLVMDALLFEALTKAFQEGFDLAMKMANDAADEAERAADEPSPQPPTR